ncbi:MAG: hypothetical protein Q4C33_04745 [bacterium]|nr:hypothetical protein [bacterium]
MKRWIKNGILVLIMILCMGVIVFTGIYASKNLSSSGGNPPSGMSSSGEVPEKPEGESSSNEPPEKPEGESSNNEAPDKPDGDTDNQIPEKPDGENNNESAPEMPSENMGMPMSNSASLSIKYYVIFGVAGFGFTASAVYLLMSKFNKLTFKETFINCDKILIFILASLLLTGIVTFVSSYVVKNNSSSDNKPNNMSGGSVTYSSANTVSEDKTFSGDEFKSTSSDENALLISGDISVSASKITVNKTGDSDGGDATSFYGNNSGVLAKDGASVYIDGATIETNAAGANGVFSYGGSATTNNTSNDGTSITISDSKITTTKDNSGGVMVTGGGTLFGNNLEIHTAGTSSAAIRSDRGGGTLVIKGGIYTTTGKGSPSVYSTADITVSDATLTSKKSEGIVIEGKNSVSLDNVTLTDTNNELNGLSTTYKNIFLYQSMSGDASVGNASFSSKDSTITTNKGDTFYVTNTKATITLENNTFKNNDKTGAFLRVEAGPWGSNGSNGGDVTLKLSKQTITGDILVDNISTLSISMTNSTYEGTINGDNTAKSITLKLDKNSKIKLTGDSYVTSLDNADSTNSNIDLNGYKLYVNGKSI